MTTNPDSDERRSALVAALVDLERHVSTAGWDQQPRLFALVHTDDLLVAEPQLAADLGLRATVDGALPHGLTAVEQDDFDAGPDVVSALAGVAWPETVFGCAIALERTFLPARFEPDIPDEADAAAEFVARHRERQDIRVVVGVDRDGHRHGVARLVSQPDELLGADNLVPGLVDVLTHTLAGQ